MDIYKVCFTERVPANTEPNTVGEYQLFENSCLRVQAESLNDAKSELFSILNFFWVYEIISVEKEVGKEWNEGIEDEIDERVFDKRSNS